ncbi:hypothetical protein V1278_007495 [Bradyrhizobium sp. AZCC 1577]
MRMTKERQPAMRTLRGWAVSVLQEAGPIRECEEHGWMQARADPHAQQRALVIARQDPPSGVSPEAAVAEVRDAWTRSATPARSVCQPDCACCDRQTIGDCDGMFFLKVREVGRILEQVLATSSPRRMIMPIQIVMDRSGDRRHPFNSDDAQELAKAEQRFYELTNAGFTAAVRTGPGQTSHLRSFDPTAEETVFFPRLVGG